MPLPELPLARIAELCREYGVTELAIFGSVARGEATPDSDIDFLYVLSDPSIGRVIRDRVLHEAQPVYAAA